MFRPPIPVPRILNISKAPLGAKIQSRAAFVVWPPSVFGSATDHFNVTARVEGDSSGMFRVVGMALADLEPDPDSPPGHRILTWKVGPMIGGTGPVSVDVGEAVLVTVEFACPSDPPQDTFTCVVVLDGLRLKTTIPVIATTNAKLTCVIQIDQGTTLGVGQAKAFPFSISSTLGHDAQAILQYDSTFSPHLSSSEILIGVPKGGTAQGFVTITNISAVSNTPHPYPVRFVVSETNGQHSSATTGLIIGASLQQNAPAVDISLMTAAEDLHQFWVNNGGLITVGLPVGPVVRAANGGYRLACVAGSLMIPPLLTTKPHSKHPRPFTQTGPQIESRINIDSVQIKGCRCFATDDPSNEDETYLVASFSWLDYDQTNKQAVGQSMTMRSPIFNGTKGNHDSTPGSVIMTNLTLTPASIAVPGSANVGFHIDLFDHELADADGISKAVAEVAQDAIAVVAGLVMALLLGPGFGLAAGAVAKLGVFFAKVGDAIRDFVKGLFDDDRIDSKDFPIDSTYLQRLTAPTPKLPGTLIVDGDNVITADEHGKKIQDIGPVPLERSSDSLLDHMRTYNYPEKVEDDSPEGQSWLFDGGSGGGTYRIFFQVAASNVDEPHE